MSHKVYNLGQRAFPENWDTIPYEEDLHAQGICDTHAPMSARAVAHVMGISKKAVKQAEHSAVSKVCQLALEGDTGAINLLRQMGLLDA